MDTNKWLELAKSTDVGRYGLTGGWRYEDRLYYCDGYRLHYQTGLAQVENRVSTIGLDASAMPSFDKVIPVETDLIGELTREDRKVLAKWLKAVNSAHSKAQVQVELDGSLGIMFRVNTVQGNVTSQVSIRVGGSALPGRTFKWAFTLKYLLDAVSLDVNCGTELRTGNNGSYGVLQLRSADFIALLMPIKPD